MSPFDARQAAEVWSRVTAAAAAPEPAGTDESELADMIREEWSDRAAYAALSRRLRGESAAALRQIAREEAAHARKLTAVYFVRTGKKPERQPDAPEPTGSMADALRERYRMETAGAALYARVAQADSEHSALFTQLSEEELRHSRTLLRLLEAHL